MDTSIQDHDISSSTNITVSGYSAPHQSAGYPVSHHQAGYPVPHHQAGYPAPHQYQHQHEGYPAPHQHQHEGYPAPHQHQQQGYPYNYSQPYVAAPCYPDAPYYGGAPQQYQYSSFEHDNHHNDVDKLQRCVFLVMIAIIFSTSIMAFATWLLFGSEIPIFSVESLFIPTFNSTNSSLSAKFMVNTTIINENEKLEFHLIGVRSRLLYNDVTLAKGDMEWDGISLGIKEGGNYLMELETNETVTKETEGRSDVMSSVYEDHKRGMMTFVLRTMVKASFKRDTMNRITYFTIICDDLNVSFNSSDGTGNLVKNLENAQPKECLIFT